MSKRSYNTYLEKVLAATGGNVYWLDQHCVYQGCNENVAKTLRLKSSKDIIGLTDHDLLRFGNWSVEQAESFARDDLEVIQTKQAKRNIEEPVIFDEAGNEVYFLTTRIPIFDEEGEVIGVVGTSADITALKKAEKSLIIAKQQAEAAHQAKTEFLASMSHDVKTPLSGVIAIAELLASREQDQDDRKLLEDVGRCGKKLLSFFENCIELSKMDMTELQKIEQAFSIHKITEAIYELFLPSATAKHLRFTVSLDPALPRVVIGNQTNIYRVILNLIGNAMKFTPQGAVDLRVQCHERVDDKNAIIQIIVKDTGIGIPKDKQQIIFEKLQRLTPSYYNKQEGHGIGLYIVDQYVKAMNGHIDVESELGQGSTFTVTVPLKIADANETNIVIPPKLTAKEVLSAAVVEPFVPLTKTVVLAENAPRVLLVEDNPLIQTVTKEILHAAGAAVDVASDGKEALALFVPGKYVVVYMDLGLPEMNGYQTTQELRALEAQKNVAVQTPILALTAHADQEIKKLCGDAGMQGVLDKPLSRLQAQQIHDYYTYKKPVTIDVLQFLKDAESISAVSSRKLKIIDFAECVTVVGDEARAKEALAMIVELLDTTFIPEISTSYDQHNDEELRKAIHKFFGSLCYVGAPALKQATVDFQTAVKEKLSTRPEVYQLFLSEIEKFKMAYLKLVKNNFQ